MKPLRLASLALLFCAVAARHRLFDRPTLPAPARPVSAAAGASPAPKRPLPVFALPEPVYSAFRFVAPGYREGAVTWDI